MICYNGNLIENVAIDPTKDRNFNYGDGLFETIKIEDFIPQNFDLHCKRLNKGMQLLAYDKADEHFFESLKENLEKLARIKNLSTARAKITVWRKDGGLYSPQNNGFNHLIQLTEFTEKRPKIQTLGIAKMVEIHPNKYSNLKTCNALVYVLAGIEKQKSGLDELIILNSEGYIAECTSSNIFWQKNGVFYTSSLESGCIEGIGRELFINELKQKNIKLEVGLFKLEDIKDSEQIVLTNALWRVVLEGEEIGFNFE